MDPKKVIAATEALIAKTSIKLKKEKVKAETLSAYAKLIHEYKALLSICNKIETEDKRVALYGSPYGEPTGMKAKT